jgi:predicted RNase H-like nuclease (RuvC/YqgF family)
MDIHSKDNIELYIEMIENVLEHCFIKDEGGCVGCKFFTGDGFEKCVQNIGIKILGLIHRLRDENTEQKAEIEQLKDENRQNLFNSNTRICELDNEKAELQKQIDELMKKNKNLKYSFDTANSYINKLAESCETNCKKFNGITTQQAVKNMAKEMYQDLKQDVILVDIPRGGEPTEEDCEAVLWWKIKDYLKKRGVEVE